MSSKKPAQNLNSHTSNMSRKISKDSGSVVKPFIPDTIIQIPGTNPISESKQTDIKLVVDSTKTTGVCGVVNVRKQELVKLGYDDFMDWITNKNNLYIGRDMSYYVPGAVGSVWGNPFPVDKVGKSGKNNKNSTPRYTLDESLIRFRQHIESSPELIAKLPELKGKTLGCWCKPKRCHGDILTELVEKYCK